jgi:Asp-tRNA(Asn)/Glu-tRNA(Gln) amidotransferase A subunit family amidase
MLDRRDFLTTCSRLGVGATLFPGTLWTLARAEEKVTREMIDEAAAIADVPIPDDTRDAIVAALNQRIEGYEAIYKLHLPNAVAPALDFNPHTGPAMPMDEKRPPRMSAAPNVAARGVPKRLEDLCFSTVRELAELMRTRTVSSVALTEMYLDRLKRIDPTLKCVITFTEDRAKAQAAEADRDLVAGRYRGPLHGLPWGAKDLLAVKGYPTTWGAGGFEHQVIDQDATVVQRLDRAGAVLIAKLTLGALALGDHWYGGITRNPWNTEQGSSGSSAGPASATAAGGVAFSIGSETLGSISAPSTRCGCTGLRPTFGRVPRTGAMALSWSMDKLGPICRSVEDCAIVLDAIAGPDDHDRAVAPHAFNWDARLDWRTLRIGYLKADFERGPQTPSLFAPPVSTAPDSTLGPEERKRRDEARHQQEANRIHAEYDRRYDQAALDKLAAMGVKMTAVELPDLPWQAMSPLLQAEAAAAFDDLTRSGRDKLLTSQGPTDWPNVFRAARFIPAVEYIQANRARTVGIEAMAKLFDQFDVIVAPTSSLQLVVTNLTGHPALILPNGFRGTDAPTFDPQPGFNNYGGPGTPVSLTFLGRLHGEAKLLAFARAYQEATEFHRQHPRL